MPVLLDSGPCGRRLFAPTEQAHPTEIPAFRVSDPHCIELGLVNNMPDLALEQTERQILKLLHDAAGDLVVCLRLYALPDVPRGELGQRHLSRLHYRDIDELWNSRLDGVVITGAEPRCPDLASEPYWHTLSETFDWAEYNTASTIASCLAVHAAVLHFDRINRQPLEEKRFGVFEFEKVCDSDLLEGVQPKLAMPHSRWNEICEDDLTCAGYDVLLRDHRYGVDTFTKHRKNLFVFFQGHPEYEAWTLLGEYRRDIARYLNGEQETYPAMPEGYFDQDSASLLEVFRDRALRNRRKELMASFPSDRLAGKLTDAWHAPAVKTFERWLQYIAWQKSHHMIILPSVAISPIRTGGWR